MIAFPLVRAAYGAVLLCVPGPLIRHVAGTRPDRRSLITARVLGVRHLAQGALTAANSGRQGLRIGASVDAMHAASMAALAAGDRNRRRIALTDGAIATTFSAFGMALARRRGRPANHPT